MAAEGKRAIAAGVHTGEAPACCSLHLAIATAWSERWVCHLVRPAHLHAASRGTATQSRAT
eukprot:12104366-Alexandrium_andersonii.AAC.1